LATRSDKQRPHFKRTVGHVLSDPPALAEPASSGCRDFEQFTVLHRVDGPRDLVDTLCGSRWVTNEEDAQVECQQLAAALAVEIAIAGHQDTQMRIRHRLQK
jgi:hypothetical protein